MKVGSKVKKGWQRPLVFAVFSCLLPAASNAAQDSPPDMPASSCVVPGSEPSTCYIDLTNIPATSAPGTPPTIPVVQPAVLNGAIFSAPDIDGVLGKGTIVGTGVFQPFVRIQESGTGNGNGVEQGLNTDYNPQILDNHNKGGTNWNHSLKLSEVGQVCIANTSGVGQTCYYEFLLDINEQGNDHNRGLSLDEFKLFTANSGSLHTVTGNDDLLGYNPNLKLDGLAPQYDMDASPGGDMSILMDYANQSGSGNGVDLQVLVPVTALSGEYVYLYSKFGVTDDQCNVSAQQQACQTPNGLLTGNATTLDYSQDAGFEEWSTRKRVPLPATPLLLALALAGMTFGRRVGGRKGR